MLKNSSTFKRALDSSRLTLTPLTMIDAVDLLSLWSEAETMHYLHVKPLDDLSTVQDMVKMLEDDRFAIRYAIRLKANGSLIGTVGINDWTPKGIEIGYELHAMYRRQGFMREVFLCLLPFIWSLTDDSIYAKVDSANMPSKELLRSFNFEQQFQSWEFNVELDKNIHISYFILQKKNFLT